ncbi:PREDICTED: aspartyl protease family protein 2-like [Nelumbo nucifera]|nr:PREDICTED: aspartyl protease family protein 2-like [Nelumbo nucifera]
MSLLHYFFLVSINGFFLVPAYGGESGDTVRFDLIHKNDPRLQRKPGLGPPTNNMEQMKQHVHYDSQRVQMISRAMKKRRKAEETATDDVIRAPFFSGASVRSGHYLIPLKVGTPPQQLIMIANTASELTWMKCGSNKDEGKQVSFDPTKSSSFQTINCSSTMCTQDLGDLFALGICPMPDSPCKYDYSYGAGQSVLGFFANETLTLQMKSGTEKKMEQFLVGCNEIIEGIEENDAIDGVVGLGYSIYSFAVRGSESFGYKFSYCLVDHFSPENVRSYLVFGETRHPPHMQHTDLVLGKVLTFYGVNVVGISLDGVMLDIPSEVWELRDDGGGTIIDEGSTLTFLAMDAYRPLMDALIKSLTKYTKYEDPRFEFCISVKPGEFNATEVPKLRIHFTGEARMEPPVKNYVIQVDDGVRCLGFQPLPPEGGVSVIGNIMQQNMFWEFDLKTSRLGFAPSSCTDE